MTDQPTAQTIPTTPVFRRLALLGIGLIGSSVARACRKHGLAGEIVGHARRQETRDEAMALGFLDRVEADPAAAVAGADAVMICAPMGAYEDLARAIAPALAPGVVVTDVGSVKGMVAKTVAPFLPAGVHLVPGHPIAGTEFVLPADLVFMAIGFAGSVQKGLLEQSGIGVSKRGNVEANEEDYRTSDAKIWAAGDMRRGQSLVVWAIREGRQAARAIDETLMGASVLPR